MAGISAMQYQPMVSQGYDFFGQVFGQLLLYGQGGGASLVNKSQPVTDSENVGIHCHLGLLEYYGLYHVCRFPSYPWQFLQFFSRRGYLARVFVYEHLCHSNQMLCLVVGIRYALDVLEYFIRCGLGHGLRSRECLEEGWGDLIYALVSTLCTENYCYQQFKWRAIFQLGFCQRHGLLEIVNYCSVSVFNSHRSGSL